MMDTLVNPHLHNSTRLLIRIIMCMGVKGFIRQFMVNEIY